MTLCYIPAKPETSVIETNGRNFLKNRDIPEFPINISILDRILQKKGGQRVKSLSCLLFILVKIGRVPIK